ALGLKPVEEQGKIDALPRAQGTRIAPQRGQLIIRYGSRVMQEPSDERALPVVHAAAGDDAQQILPIVARDRRGDGGAGGRRREAVKSIHRASFVPCSPGCRCRSAGPAVPMWSSSSAPAAAPPDLQ